RVRADAAACAAVAPGRAVVGWRRLRSRHDAPWLVTDADAVEECAGIGDFAVLPDFEVQVATVGVAAGSSAGDLLAGGDVLADLDEDAAGIHVHVPGGDTATVADFQPPAAAAGLAYAGDHCRR